MAVFFPYYGTTVPATMASKCVRALPMTIVCLFSNTQYKRINLLFLSRGGRGGFFTEAGEIIFSRYFVGLNKVELNLVDLNEG